jgi:hypothetical protein
MRAAHAVFQEGIVADRAPALERIQHGLGIDTDLVLRMSIGAQRQEMHEVVEVRLPVPLRIEAERQVHAGELARESGALGIERLAAFALVQHLEIVLVDELGVLLQQVEDLLGFLARQHLVAALPVHRALGREMLGLRNVELVVEDRVACGIFVHVGRAMTDPLSRHENRQLHMVLDLAHLERRRVTMPHEIVDETAILADLLGAAAVAHPCGLHHGGIVAHVVDDADEAVIEHGQRLVENLLQRRGDGTQGRLGTGSGLVDFSLLVAREGHRFVVLVCAGLYERGGAPAMGKYPDPPRLQNAERSAYIGRVGKPTMAINAAWHKRFGPGGSTRRLHHFSPPSGGTDGGEPGSTSVVKARFLPGMVPP